MARTDHYTGVTPSCVMCGKPIPPTRKWDSVTCGKECTVARKNYGRSRRDHEGCRYCYRPSSPEERSRYKRWHKWEEAGIPETDSAAQLLRLVASLKRKLAELTSPEDAEAIAERERKRIVQDRMFDAVERENERLKIKLAKLTGEVEGRDDDDDETGTVPTDEDDHAKEG